MASPSVRITAALGLAAACCCLSLRAEARQVYLNGVKLEASVVLTNQRFDGCEVKFDEQGDVWISVKGIKVALAPVQSGKVAVASSASAPPSAKLLKRYWLVAPQAKRGLVQYDVSVVINGTLVKKLRSDDDRAIVDVTRYVRPGQNEVRIVATKRLGDKRISSSPVDVTEVVLGEGAAQDGTVTIDKPLVTYRRNASETRDFSDTYSFLGQ
ncbi:MAG: hypothetical protein HY698_10425 [Deltaproteobacteria bacterium]|nr:hypothetical protein [Deltaproteobacteria bacterium]